MSDSPSLDQVLNNELVPDVEPVVEAEVSPEVSDTEEITGDKVEPSSTPEPKTTESGMVPIAALLDEREKRQALENQIRSQMPQQKAPDIFDDQEGFVSHLEKTFTDKLSQIEAATNVKIARIQYSDYDTKAAEFQKLAEANELLAQQAMRSGNAPDFAYKYMQQQEQIAKASDPEFINKQIEEGIQKRLLEMRNEGLIKDIDAKLSSPPSLSNQRAAGSNSKAEWSGPVSLDQALK